MAGMTVAHALVAAAAIDQLVNAAEGDDAAGFDDTRRLLGMLMIASKDARDAVFQTPGFREAVRQAKMVLCRRLCGWTTDDVRVGLYTGDFGKNREKIPYSQLDVAVEFFSPKGVLGPVRLWKNAYNDARGVPHALQVGLNYPGEDIEDIEERDKHHLRKQVDACHEWASACREWTSVCVIVRDMLQCSELKLVMACDEINPDGWFDAWCIFVDDDLKLDAWSNFDCDDEWCTIDCDGHYVKHFDCDVTGPELAVTLELRDGDESADETLRRLMEPARWISLVDGTAGHPPPLDVLRQRFVLDDSSDDE